MSRPEPSSNVNINHNGHDGNYWAKVLGEYSQEKSNHTNVANFDRYINDDLRPDSYVV